MKKILGLAIVVCVAFFASESYAGTTSFFYSSVTWIAQNGPNAGDSYISTWNTPSDIVSCGNNCTRYIDGTLLSVNHDNGLPVWRISEYHGIVKKSDTTTYYSHDWDTAEMAYDFPSSTRIYGMAPSATSNWVTSGTTYRKYKCDKSYPVNRHLCPFPNLTTIIGVPVPETELNNEQMRIDFRYSLWGSTHTRIFSTIYTPFD